jgi:hypothetical protein
LEKYYSIPTVFGAIGGTFTKHVHISLIKLPDLQRPKIYFLFTIGL